MGSKTWFEEGETASANAGIDPFEDRLISSLHASKLYSKENDKKKPMKSVGRISIEFCLETLLNSRNSLL